mgnify:CR=1 FL=1
MPRPGGVQYNFPSFSFEKFQFPDFAPDPFTYPDFAPPPTTAGTFAPPSWDVEEYEAAPGFDYPEFEGPTAETFKADPGYDFRAREMQRAIENAASARGLLATGGTLQDLMTARGSLASQEFGNVWNRQFGGWQANRGAAADAHDRNERNRLNAYRLKYGAESDEFGRALAEYNAKSTGDEENFRRSLTTYLTGYGAEQDKFGRARDIYTTNLGKEMGSRGLNLDTARVGIGQSNDKFNQLLNLYGLATRNLPTYNPMPLPTS